MAVVPRQYLKGGVAVVAALALALPPALAALSRTDRIRETGLSDAMLGQFTPAAGDPRLIARYAQVSEKARQNFSFTPALTSEGRSNRAITVVVRSRQGVLGSGDAARVAALAAGRTQPVAIAPVAYDLGASVGFKKFATPQVSRGLDISNLPQALALRKPEGNSRFATRMTNRSTDPAAAPARATAPGAGQAVDVEGSYRVTRNLDVTAGVRYYSDQRAEPLTDNRRDSQAVYVGTQFRF